MIGKDHGRAELGEGPQPRQQDPGGDAGQRRGNCHSREAAHAAETECRRDLLEGGVDRGEGRARGDDQEGRRDEDLSQDDPCPRVGQLAAEQFSGEREGTDDIQQQDAAHQRRQGERKRHQRQHQPPHDTPRLRASRYASGVPRTVITTVETVAVNSDVASAEPSPGEAGAPPARRTANATIGTSR